ncbi:MAG: hypothetical protein KDB10_08660 [Acidimicrobiales bacterium]|nr:hypothetical protein [Acidimicrobiales bacterium]MCB9371420.1 hypothetical protein [Microthrixaceae bacterium]
MMNQIFGQMMFWLLVSVAITAVVLFLVYRMVAGMTGNTRAGRELMATGADAPATVLALQQTGTYVNMNPQVVLTLQVSPPGQAAFQAQTSTILPMVAVPQVQPGAVINVKYDPADHSKVLVNFGA